MSDITFDCPKCGHNLAVDARGAGLSVPCPICKAQIQIPEPNIPTQPPLGNDRYVGANKKRRTVITICTLLGVCLILVLSLGPCALARFRRSGQHRDVNTTTPSSRPTVYPILKNDPRNIHPATEILYDKIGVAYALLLFGVLSSDQRFLEDHVRLKAYVDSFYWEEPQHIRGDVYRVTLTVFSRFDIYGSADVRKLQWLVNTNTSRVEAETSTAQMFLDAQYSPAAAEKVILTCLTPPERQ